MTTQGSCTWVPAAAAVAVVLCSVCGAACYNGCYIACYNNLNCAVQVCHTSGSYLAGCATLTKHSALHLMFAVACAFCCFGFPCLALLCCLWLVHAAQHVQLSCKCMQMRRALLVVAALCPLLLEVQQGAHAVLRIACIQRCCSIHIIDIKAHTALLQPCNACVAAVALWSGMFMSAAAVLRSGNVYVCWSHARPCLLQPCMIGVCCGRGGLQWAFVTHRGWAGRLLYPVWPGPSCALFLFLLCGGVGAWWPWCCRQKGCMWVHASRCVMLCCYVML